MPAAIKSRRRKTKVSRFLEAWLAARQMIQAANFNRFAQAGLSATQFMTLNLIPSESGMTLTELARRMNLGASTLTKTIDSLEARGLLTRTKSATDRRHVLLALTAKGEALQNAASAEFHDQMATLFGELSTEEREGLVHGLEALVAAGVRRSAGVSDADRSAKRSSARSLPLRS